MRSSRPRIILTWVNRLTPVCHLGKLHLLAHMHYEGGIAQVCPTRVISKRIIRRHLYTAFLLLLFQCYLLDMITSSWCFQTPDGPLSSGGAQDLTKKKNSRFRPPSSAPGAFLKRNGLVRPSGLAVNCVDPRYASPLVFLCVSRARPEEEGWDIAWTDRRATTVIVGTDHAH